MSFIVNGLGMYSAVCVLKTFGLDRKFIDCSILLLVDNVTELFLIGDQE